MDEEQITVYTEDIEQPVDVNEESIAVISPKSYNDLSDKPQINDVELIGNKSFAELGLAQVASSGSYTDLSDAPTIPTIPTNVSAFTNDAGYLTSVAWNDVSSKPTFATVATSGSYNDLSDRPTIPSPYTLPAASSNTLGGVKVGANLSIDANNVLSATDTTYSSFEGTDGQTAGTTGLVPAPTTSDADKYLKSDGTWATVSGGGGTEMVVLSYGISTWNNFITAYQNNAIVYCRASSSSDPSSGTQGRMAFMAYINNATNPTEVEFQYYRSVSSHSATQQGDQVFVYKLTSSGAWSVTTREAASKIVAGSNMTSSYSSGTLTLNATVPTLYSTTGQNTDGAVTQKLFTDTVGDVETILQTLNTGSGAS